jgi:hypothetical protein
MGASHPTPEPPPLNVMAVVDKIEGNGYQDLMTDGSVISWTLVTFVVARPEPAWGTPVRAYCVGHPFLGGAPLLIGQTVTFDLPPPARREGIPLEQLEQLQRAQ